MNILKTTACALCLCAGGALQAQGTFVIEGSVKNVEDGALMVLFRMDGQAGSGIGRDTLRDGKFRFRLETEGVGTEKLSLMGVGDGFPSMSCPIWVRPGSHVRVSGNDPMVATWQVESDLPEQCSWNAYQEATRTLQDELQRGLITMAQIRRTASAETRKQRSDSLYQALNVINFRIDSVTILRMQQAPVDAVWMEKLEGLARGCKFSKEYPWRAEAIALYDRLTEEQKQSSAAQGIYVSLYPPRVVEVGEPMADGDLYDLDGNLHHLADLKGRHILLDFWSRGCGPCVMALPEMKQIAELYADRLAVVSLSIDTEQGWRKASQAHEMTWLNWSDLKGESGLYTTYGSTEGIPRYVLISPEGQVLKKWTGYGAGRLKMTMKRWLDAVDRTMSVATDDAGNRIVRHPTVAKASTDQLEVLQVVQTPEGTAVHLRIYQLPKYWVQIAGGTRLETPDGTACALLRAEGITPDERFFMPESGEVDVVLHFAPLPAGTRSCSLIEPGGAGAYRMEGIALGNEE